MARFKDIAWNLPDEIGTWERVQIAVLMDIRDELKRISGALCCPNATRIPRILDRISANTYKRRSKKVKARGKKK